MLPNWRATAVPPDVRAIPTMLLQSERQLLFSIARDYFRNEGSIIDAGCFLGGSTLSLGRGLQENSLFKSAPRENVITSYDRFVIEPWTIGRYFPEGTPLDHSFLPTFRSNVSALGDIVDVRAGDILESGGPPDGTIEILFIDVAKTMQVNDYIAEHFFPALAPGHSLVIQQDYVFSAWNGWIHVTMEYFSEHFEIIDSTESNSVVFLYTKPIPPERLRKVVGRMSRSQMTDLQDRAIARFTGEKREKLLQARDHFQSLLDKWNWQ